MRHRTVLGLVMAHEMDEAHTVIQSERGVPKSGRLDSVQLGEHGPDEFLVVCDLIGLDGVSHQVLCHATTSCWGKRRSALARAAPATGGEVSHVRRARGHAATSERAAGRRVAGGQLHGWAG